MTQPVNQNRLQHVYISYMQKQGVPSPKEQENAAKITAARELLQGHFECDSKGNWTVDAATEETVNRAWEAAKTEAGVKLDFLTRLRNFFSWSKSEKPMVLKAANWQPPSKQTPSTISQENNHSFETETAPELSTVEPTVDDETILRQSYSELCLNKAAVLRERDLNVYEGDSLTEEQKITLRTVRDAARGKEEHLLPIEDLGNLYQALGALEQNKRCESKEVRSMEKRLKQLGINDKKILRMALEECAKRSIDAPRQVKTLRQLERLISGKSKTLEAILKNVETSVLIQDLLKDYDDERDLAKHITQANNLSDRALTDLDQAGKELVKGDLVMKRSVLVDEAGRTVYTASSKQPDRLGDYVRAMVRCRKLLGEMPGRDVSLYNYLYKNCIESKRRGTREDFSDLKAFEAKVPAQELLAAIEAYRREHGLA